jgi:hypothetical protein
VSFYLARNGQQLGPFSELELREMIAAGKVASTDLVWAPGDAAWHPLSTVPGFAPIGPPPLPVDRGSGLIPTGNPPALVAYYLAVFSLIPCFGVLLAIPAVVLGIIGLRKAKAHPEAKGAAHAWFATILGLLTGLLWSGVGIFLIVSK